MPSIITPGLEHLRRSGSPWFPLRSGGFALLIMLAVGGPTRGADPVSLIETHSLPEGTIEARKVWLEAPDAACIAYLDTFSHRSWTVLVPSRGAFLGLLFGLDLSDESRAALADQKIWTPLPDGQGFVLRPPSSLPAGLSTKERQQLYALLAQWPQNKPERWPLVLPANQTFDRLREANIPEEVLTRLRQLAYPFAGGLALSDFSVLATEFPDRPMLLRLLQAASTVESTLPRLDIRSAARVSDALAYWTVNHHNPFALPLLEALLESETTDGVELVSVLPGAARLLSLNLEARDVSHDTSLKSFLISASLASLPRTVRNAGEFVSWFERAFQPVPAPYRYGDVLVLEYPGEPRMDYACAFIAADLVFAKDPVGLGLWRFMRINELLARNPHFAGGRFIAHRITPPRAGSPP